MTRKQALHMALEALEALAASGDSTATYAHEAPAIADDSTATKALEAPVTVSDSTAAEALKTPATADSTAAEAQAACDVIRAMLSDLPLTSWTEKTIFDSINQFITDNGRTPTASDFRKKGLPPHPVIKLRFGKTLREFLDMYYPAKKLCDSKIYSNKSRDEWQDLFVSEYHKIKPGSAEEYNARRPPGSPSWATVARLFGITKWLNWLIHCDIVPYIAKRNHYYAPRPKLTSTHTIHVTPKKGGGRPFKLIKSADGVIRMTMDLTLGSEEFILYHPPEVTDVKLGYQ